MNEGLQNRLENAATLPDGRVDVLVARLRRIFLASSLLNVLCIALIIILAPHWSALPSAAKVGVPAVLLWSLTVTAYAFVLLNQTSESIRDGLRRQTYHDQTTGVFSDRYLNMRLQEEVERIKRQGGATAVLYLDLDGFKSVNDRFGHQTGNMVLRQIAALLSQRVRLCDVFGRIGGDEFLVVLPGTDRREAYVLAERLRETVEDYRLRIKESETIDSVRLSVGIASFPEDGESIEEVITAADNAVYESKAQGGNRVTLASESSEQRAERRMQRDGKEAGRRATEERSSS